MKRIFSKIATALCALIISFALFSCDRTTDSPVTEPGPEVKFADWSKVEFRFTEGHSHGYFHGKADYPVKYLKPVQSLYFTRQNGKVVADPKNQPIRWQAAKGKGLSLYALEIIYFDKDGKRINNSFTSTKTGEQYQHFFIPENITPRSGNVGTVSAKDIFGYVYSDTDPEDQYFRNSLTGLNPNVTKLLNDFRGLKGVFEVTKPYQNFDLKIVLGKFSVPKTAYKFDELPTKDFKKAYEFSFPVHIYTSRDASSQTQLQDAMKEYGVSAEEIENDEDIILDSPVNPESSKVFLHLN